MHGQQKKEADERADYDASVRVHAELDTANVKKGGKEVEAELDNIEKKASKTKVSVQWDKAAAEAQIDAILERKKREAEAQQVESGGEEGWVRSDSEREFDSEAAIASQERILREIEAQTEELEGQKGKYDDLLHRAENYKSVLQKLHSTGYGPGDKVYDDAYISWQNAEYALKQYLSELDKQTDAGIAKEAERAQKVEEQKRHQQELADIQASAVVSNQNLVDLLRKQSELLERQKLLKEAGVGEGYQEFDNNEVRLKQLRAEIDKQRNGFTKASSSAKKFFTSLNKNSKQSAGILGSLIKKILGIEIAVFVFNQIRKAFNAMVSLAKEGFQNLAQYSDDYNGQMSALKSSLAETKNALAAAFEPVVNTIIPYLTQMINWLNVAIDAVGQFFAALKGSSTYTKASKQAIDYAQSLDTASQSAKRALASFDELNVLNDSSDSSTAGGEATGADAFETAEVSSQIRDAVESIQALIQPFIDSISEWWDGLDFEPLLTSLDNLKTACEPFAGYLYDGMKWFLDEILLPIGSWVIEDGLPTFLDTLTECLNALSTVIEVVKPGLSYIWENVLKPMGEYTGELFIEALNQIKENVAKFAEMMEEHSDEINTILTAIGQVLEIIWNKHIKPVLDFIIAAVGELVGYIINLVGDLIDVLAGIINFITGVFTGDWEKAWDGLVGIFTGIINGIIDTVEGAVNAIIAGVNKLSFDVPDWVPEIGGGTFGFNLERLELPRLANGAVIQGGKPFAAILGDQRAGQTNIETPLSTMVEAFKQAMAETGGAGGSYTFVAQLDGYEIFRETVRQDQIFHDSTGNSAFAY